MRPISQKSGVRTVLFFSIIPAWCSTNMLPVYVPVRARVSSLNRLYEAVTASVSDVIVGKKQVAELKKKYSENEIENVLFDMYLEHRYDERKSLSTEKLIDIKNKM